jgi:exodeoxyribonuclease VII large subunit
VQGSSAAKEIAAAIRQVNKRNSELKIDVLIVGRGGGSMEDLWAFNEEPVARAIYASKIPVISAVGHEIDFTIADYVADARASTPTKAGVIAVPDVVEVLERISASERRLRHNAERNLEVCMYRLEAARASSVFRNPYLIVNNAGQQLDEAGLRLGESARRMFAEQHEKLTQAQQRVMRIEPHRLIGEKKVQVNSLCSALSAAVINAANAKQPVVERLESRMKNEIMQLIAKKQLQLTAGQNRLAGLNPRSVLQRGYSITSLKKTGKVVGSADQVKSGDMLVTELAGNEKINSKVVD